MSPEPEQVTLGELSRNLQSLERRIDVAFAQINERFDKLQFVTREVYEVRHEELSGRVADLEDRNRWLTRTTVAAFLFPLAVAVVVALVVTR